MQNINDMKQYIEQQYQCRDIDSFSNKAIKKDELQDVTRRVESCIEEFNKLNENDKKNATKNMRNIVSNFNKILQLEEGVETAEIRSIFNQRMLSILPEVFIAGGSIRQFDPVVLVKDNPSGAKLKENMINITKKFFRVNSRGGHYEAKNFVEKILERFVAERETSVKEVNFKEMFLNEARKMYSPVKSPAGDLFTEEEMLELMKEYYSNRYDTDYSYQDYDQALLKECIDLFVDPDSLDIPWQSIELVRFRIGNSPRDFKELINILDIELSSPQFTTLLREWESKLPF